MPVVTNYTAILSGASWSGFDAPANRPAFVTYSFESVLQSYANTSYATQAFLDSFIPFTETEKAATRAALAQWASASGIIFLEVASGEGDMRFGSHNFSLDPNANGFSGFAFYPNTDISQYNAFRDEIGGDVFIDHGAAGDTYLLLHEIGHALGFKHPFDGDVTLSSDLDNHRNTVMSYTGNYPSVLSQFDKQAAAAVYGAAGTGGTHLTSWSWNSASRELTQVATANSEKLFGVSVRDIIDGGGGDDWIGGFQGDDSLSGGMGNDSLFGNEGTDGLYGGAGSDLLYGGLGNDFLVGGTGVDILTGGSEFDWFAFANGDAEGDFVGDYGADILYFGGTGTLSFSVSGANVIVNGVTLTGAASGNVNAVAQGSTALLNSSGMAAAAVAGGLGSLGAYGTYEITIFDADSNDTWQTISEFYTTLNQHDQSLTRFDVGQPYSAILTDYDQAGAQNWNQLYFYYDPAGLTDIYWVYNDNGQKYTSTLVDVDQTGANLWNETYSSFSGSNALDVFWTYYDIGQSYSAILIDYDDLSTQLWSQAYTYYTPSGAADVFWFYYDAGQPIATASIDVDQNNNQSWSQVYTYYTASGQADSAWTYNDAGQPVYSRFTDYDQANQYAWSQHIVEFAASGSVLNDYYV
jgi:Ca2+-binding RTX toxin-like protein